MKTEKSEILEKLGKDPGFKVPDGFFEQFAQQLDDKLPEVTITDVEEKTSTWVKWRPFVYMAAMFAGVWCMMSIFDRSNGSGDIDQRAAELRQEMTVEENADEAIKSGVVSFYDYMTYDDSTATE
ncbi:MAG: hypothetical protein J6X70_04540 [Muribaculaceae bacterium]|nr:hypothetical protein [Muribaculaceae bacterium]